MTVTAPTHRISDQTRLFFGRWTAAQTLQMLEPPLCWGAPRVQDPRQALFEDSWGHGPLSDENETTPDRPTPLLDTWRQSVLNAMMQQQIRDAGERLWCEIDRTMLLGDSAAQLGAGGQDALAIFHTAVGRLFTDKSGSQESIDFLQRPSDIWLTWAHQRVQMEASAHGYGSAQEPLFDIYLALFHGGSLKDATTFELEGTSPLHITPLGWAKIGRQTENDVPADHAPMTLGRMRRGWHSLLLTAEEVAAEWDRKVVTPSFIQALWEGGSDKESRAQRLAQSLWRQTKWAASHPELTVGDGWMTDPIYLSVRAKTSSAVGWIGAHFEQLGGLEALLSWQPRQEQEPQAQTATVDIDLRTPDFGPSTADPHQSHPSPAKPREPVAAPSEARHAEEGEGAEADESGPPQRAATPGKVKSHVAKRARR